MRAIAEVTTAVARGDLSKKITADVQGEILELKNTINTMVDQLNSFASEVTRVAGEVGTEGRLGGQAQVKGVAGTWKDLTDNVNTMAANLTGQVRAIAQVTTAVAHGDLSKKMTADAKGEHIVVHVFACVRVCASVLLRVYLCAHACVPVFARFCVCVCVRVRARVRVSVRGVIIDMLMLTTRTTGEILELKNTINNMIDQLNSFASEVTRVAREVGTEGKLGGQAQVPGVAGTWKDLTDNVSFTNLFFSSGVTNTHSHSPMITHTKVCTHMLTR